MASIQNIKGSDGTGAASRATVTANRPAANPTIAVDTLANWPAQFIGVTGTPDLVTNTIQSASLQVFFGHESSGTIVIDSFAPGYEDSGNSIGDIVILKPTTAWSDEIAALLAVAHNDDGTIKDTVIEGILNDGLTADDLRIKPRISVIDTVATLTPNVDTFNYYRVTAQGGPLTIANKTGTPLDGEGLLIEIQDNGTTRALTWGSDYTVDSIYGLTLPTTTVAGKTHFITFVWNEGLSKYVAVL